MSRFTFCNCPAGFSAEPERHAPDCPGRFGAGKARTPVPVTIKPAEQHQGDPVAPVINAEQVLGAYQFASFGPANHLRGTTNWCAAFAQELNHRIGADTAEVERIGKELREVREERDDLRRRVDDFQSRSHGIKNLSVIEQLNDKLAERDALLARTLPYLSNTPDLVQHGAEDLAEEIRNVSAGRPCYGPNEWGTECGKCSKCKPASAEPSAPVEIDERAAFEAWYADWFNDLYKPTKPLTAESMKQSRKGNDYGAGSLGKNGKWAGWQARSSLERKP